jgi:hypothetical protein
MHDHVIYESRLEPSPLISADFDRSVHRVLAQPFLRKAKINGKIRKHVPDYFLGTTWRAPWNGSPATSANMAPRSTTSAVGS